MSIMNKKGIENGIDQSISRKNEKIPDLVLVVTHIDIFYE